MKKGLAWRLTALIAVLLLTFATAFFVSAASAVPQRIDGDFGDDTQYEAPIDTNPAPENIVSTDPIDIILNSFVLDKSEFFVNESITGFFNVTAFVPENSSFNAKLNFGTSIRLNESGIYNLTPFSFDQPGNFEVILSLDSDNEINETDESNNNASIPVTIIRNETAPINLTDEPRIAVQLNDFILDESRIYINETVSGRFTVTEENSINAFEAELIVLETGYEETFVINSNGTYEITPINFSAPGNFTIMIRVDPNNELNEINASNTNASMAVEVLPIYEPELPPPPSGVIPGHTKDYIYLNGKLIASSSNDAKVLFYFTDDQSSVRLVADDSGVIMQENDYEPFGFAFPESNLSDRKNSGKENDDTGLDYFGARYYDSATGRWISADPVIDYESSPYSYNNNNPLVFTDPDGRNPKKIGGLTQRERAEQDKYYTFDGSVSTTRNAYFTGGRAGQFLSTYGDALTTLMKIPQAYLEYRLGKDKTYFDPVFVKNFNSFFMSHGVEPHATIELPAACRYSCQLHNIDSDPTHPTPMFVTKDDLLNVMGNIETEQDYYTFMTLVEAREEQPLSFSDPSQSGRPVLRDRWDNPDQNVYFDTFGMKLDAKLRKAYYAMQNRALFEMEPDQGQLKITAGR